MTWMYIWVQNLPVCGIPHGWGCSKSKHHTSPISSRRRKFYPDLFTSYVAVGHCTDSSDFITCPLSVITICFSSSAYCNVTQFIYVSYVFFILFYFHFACLTGLKRWNGGDDRHVKNWIIYRQMTSLDLFLIIGKSRYIYTHTYNA